MEPRYSNLRILASMYWDCQDFRKAMDNKTRSRTVDEVVAVASGHYRQVEKDVSKAMVRELRAVAPPEIRAWIAESAGVGEHLAAKLLGVIGDPYAAHPMRWEGEGKGERHLVAGPPFARNLGKLWAYCGVGDPARRRRKGMTAEAAAAAGSWQAKATLRVIAESCTKQPGSPYDLVYRKAREQYDSRVHAAKCGKCKESGEPGQPWKAGHQHAAALRKVAKEVLRDLWEAARAAHWREQAGQQQAA